MTNLNKYRVYATYTTTLYTIVEAEDAQEAYEIAKDMDGADFRECGELGDWHIESDPDLVTWEEDDVYS